MTHKDKLAEFRVYGQVQGVGFRYFAKRVAEKLNIKGNVKNLPDGTVQILAQGDEETLRRFLEIIRKGPPFSSVIKITVTGRENPTHFQAFEIGF